MHVSFYSHSIEFESVLMSLGFADIQAAAARLKGVARRTPALTSTQFDLLLGGTAYFKAENLQRTGAFKFRGAYNALSQFSPEQCSRGVVTYSSGKINSSCISNSIVLIMNEFQ